MEMKVKIIYEAQIFGRKCSKVSENNNLVCFVESCKTQAKPIFYALFCLYKRVKKIPETSQPYSRLRKPVLAHINQ